MELYRNLEHIQAPNKNRLKNLMLIIDKNRGKNSKIQ